MNRTAAHPSQTATLLSSTDAGLAAGRPVVHPALAASARWPALALSLALTAAVLAGADGLARHEARQAQALAASWAAEGARVAQADQPTSVVLVQARRSSGA